MKSKSFIFRLSFIILMLIVAAIVYPSLPDIIPIHWNFAGEPDNWGAKTWAAWMIPGLSLILLALFPLLAKIDPRHKSYEQFSGAYNTIQNLLILFFGFIFGIQYLVTLLPEYQSYMPALMLSALGITFIVMGNLMGKVRQNYFVGLRTPWTLDDKEVWQKSQRFGGWAFVLGGIVFLIQAWLQQYIITTFIGVIAAVVLIPVIYSYVLFKRKE